MGRLYDSTSQTKKGSSGGRLFQSSPSIFKAYTPVEKKQKLNATSGGGSVDIPTRDQQFLKMPWWKQIFQPETAKALFTLPNNTSQKVGEASLNWLKENKLTTPQEMGQAITGVGKGAAGLFVNALEPVTKYGLGPISGAYQLLPKKQKQKLDNAIKPVMEKVNNKLEPKNQLQKTGAGIGRLAANALTYEAGVGALGALGKTATSSLNILPKALPAIGKAAGFVAAGQLDVRPGESRKDRAFWDALFALPGLGGAATESFVKSQGEKTIRNVADTTAREILGVSKNATENDIKAAYRNLAKTAHPDAGGNVQDFNKVNKAYQILKGDIKDPKELVSSLHDIGKDTGIKTKPAASIPETTTVNEIPKVTEQNAPTEVKLQKATDNTLMKQARNFDSAESFTKEVSKVIAKKNVSPNEQVLKDAFLQYTHHPEVRSRYPQGATDKQVLTDIYNTAKRSSTAKSVVENKFNSRVFERLKAEQPDVLKGNLQYEQRNLKKDMEDAVKLVATDKQKAFQVAMDESNPLSVSTSIALQEKALQEGNNKLYSQMVKTRSLAQTRRGQALVAEKGSVSDNSTSRYVRELIDQRLNQLGDKYLSDLKTTATRKSTKQLAMDQIDQKVEKLQRTIKSKKLDTKTALNLLDKLQCLT